MSTLMKSDAASKRGYEQATSDGAVLLDALTNLWEQTKHQSETSKRRAIETYAANLASYHPPSVLRVLREWPRTEDWWPTLHQLHERLPDPDWRPRRESLPPPEAKRSRGEIRRLVETALRSDTGQQALREGWGRSLADWVEDHGNAYPTLKSIEWIKMGNREFQRSLGEQKDAGRAHLVRLGEAMLRREANLAERFLHD